jgi:hypothetical protein
MTAAEIGVYIRMLCYQWDKGYLPNNIELLNAMFGAPVTQPVVDKFVASELGLINTRLDEERKQANAKVEKLKSNGKKGSAKRWASDTFETKLLSKQDPAANFYIGIEPIYCNPSQWMQNNALKYVETQLMKQSLSSNSLDALRQIYIVLDTDYATYTFNNSNHIKNAFRTCMDKVLNKNKGKNDKASLSIHGSASFE